MNYPKRVYLAAKQGNISLLNTIALKAVMEQDTDGLVEWQDASGRAALNIAIFFKRWNCVEWLVIMGANVNHRGQWNGEVLNTALHDAIKDTNCPLSVLETLLEAGAKMMIESAQGLTTWDLMQRQMPRKEERFRLFSRYLTNDAIFDDLVHVTEKKTSRYEQGSMRRVMVLHRYTAQDHIRRVILIYDVDNPSTDISHWIDTIDLDPPNMCYLSSFINIQFKCQPLLRAETKMDDIGFRFGLNVERRSELMEHFLGALQIEVPDPPALQHQPTDHLLNDIDAHIHPQIAEVSVVMEKMERSANGMSHENLATTATGSTSSGARRAEMKLCVICLERPVNTGFVHGSSMHCCACVSCADAIKKIDRAHCPICREEIENVIRDFFI